MAAYDAILPSLPKNHSPTDNATTPAIEFIAACATTTWATGLFPIKTGATHANAVPTNSAGATKLRRWLIRS